MPDMSHLRPMLPARSGLSREIDRLFGDFFPSFAERETKEAPALWSPRLDMSEKDKEFLITLDLPGIPKEDVAVHVEDHQLTISGERKQESHEETENYLRMERSYGRFFRSIPMPKNSVTDKVKAEFKNGEMRIHIPKEKETKPRKISID